MKLPPFLLGFLLCLASANATPNAPQSDAALLGSLKVAIDAGDIVRAQSLIKEIEQRGTLSITRHADPNAGENEKAAEALLSEIRDLIANGDMSTAQRKLAQLGFKYSGTRADKRGIRVAIELGLIGNPAPEIAVDTWLANGERYAPIGAKVTVLIFWEEWCPHCRREVPRLDKIYEKYAAQGLQIIGITRVSRSSTPAKVRDFIESNGVDYPIGRDIENPETKKGTLSTTFQISGIPAVGVIKDGTIIWRGHPASVKDALVERWLKD